MTSADQILSEAITFHRTGDLARAEPLYRRLLLTHANNPDVLHLYGVLCHQQGRHDEAVTQLTAAVQLSQADPIYWFDLANAFLDTGRHAEAEAAYSRTISIRPDMSEAHFRLGNCYRAGGDFERAAACYRRTVEVNRTSFAAYCNLGAALRELRRPEEAEKAFLEAVHLKPDFVEGHNNLGLVFLEQEKVDQAILAFRQVLRLEHNHPEVHCNLGSALHKKGLLAEARICLDRALRERPEYPEAHVNLGNLLAELREFDDAKEHYVAALKVRPDYADAYYNLGNLMRESNHLDEAITCFQHALRLDPHYIAAYTNSGETYQVMGEIDKAEEYHRAALAADPACDLAYSNLLACMNYSARYSPSEIYREHLRWGAHLGLSRTPRMHYSNKPDPDRRIRVGYVSADLGIHPVSSFLAPLLAHHDHSVIEVFLYWQGKRADARTDFFKSTADTWRATASASDSELATTILADRIDVLVDCAGHTAGNRLGVFARKPAPVQATYLGYPNTTGLRMIDARLTDAVCDPEGEPVCHSEDLVRVPGGFFAWEPASAAPAVSVLPSVSRGHITFGSLHTLARLNSSVIDLWSSVLRAVPGSRLRIFRTTLTPEAIERLLRLFAVHGSEIVERVDFIREIPAARTYLSAYDDIDIALDTHPWSGHTTACEALWMGVPTITLLGNRHAGRMVADALTLAGLPEYIAESPEQFVAIASRTAADRGALDALRSGMRDRLRRSALLDGVRVARAMEETYRALWRNWCATKRG